MGLTDRVKRLARHPVVRRLPLKPALKRPGPKRPAPAVAEAPFRPTSWAGALAVMAALGALLWLIQLVNAIDDQRLNRFGLRPREVGGLDGVVTAPFLHAGAGHLFSNTLPFVLLGWVLLLSGVRSWLLVTGVVIAVGGLATWLVAPSGLVVGASGLIFGWLGYLLARAWFARKILWIVAALLVLVFFGGLLLNLLPTAGSGVSWQGHLCGFTVGVALAYVLHPRPARRGTAPSRRPRNLSS